MQKYQEETDYLYKGMNEDSTTTSVSKITKILFI